MPDASPSWSQAPTPAPPRNRMEPHVTAVVEIVLGSLTGLFALLLLAVFGIGSAVTGAATDVGWLPGFLAAFGLFFALLVGVFAALGLAAGILLLKRRRAGKGFAIAAAVVHLLGFPIGTAFGIYALVILTRPETDQLLVD